MFKINGMFKLKRRYKDDKEYVFLTSAGSLIVLKFKRLNQDERLVLARKDDALLASGLMRKINIPLTGYFTWPYDYVFGKHRARWDFLGEL